MLKKIDVLDHIVSLSKTNLGYFIENSKNLLF